MRVVQGESTYYGHVDGLAEEDLLRVAGSVSEAVRGDASEPAALRSMTSGPRHAVAIPPEEVEAARKADLLRACDERARAAGAEVAQARIGYVEAQRQVEVFGSDGRAAADDRTRIRLSAQVVARRNGRVETGTDTRGGHAGWELLEDEPESVAAKAAERALTLLDAVDAPDRPAAGRGGQRLRRRAAARGGRPRPRGRRRSEGREHLRRAGSASRSRPASSPPTTTAAGRTRGGARGRRRGHAHAAHDGDRGGGAHLLPVRPAEGAEGRRRVDGNGRRESFRHVPVPRMTNTFFAPGDATPDDLIGGVERGLYAVSFGGGQVEPATGDFVFGVSEGYLIENGRVTAPVRGATLVGNGLEALRAIDGIAGDLEIATGYCGKGGQTVPAGVGQPHVRIRELTVGGTAA